LYYKDIYNNKTKTNAYTTPICICREGVNSSTLLGKGGEKRIASNQKNDMYVHIFFFLN